MESSNSDVTPGNLEVFFPSPPKWFFLCHFRQMGSRNGFLWHPTQFTIENYC